MENRTVLASLIMGGLFALSGCATSDSADADIARAKLRVEQAQQGGAGQHAAVELQQSVETLRKAEAAAADGDDDEAIRLARRAELDADLAEAKSSRAKADAAAKEVRSGTESLREEADRALSTPDVPAAEFPTKEQQ